MSAAVSVSHAAAPLETDRKNFRVAVPFVGRSASCSVSHATAFDSERTNFRTTLASPTRRDRSTVSPASVALVGLLINDSHVVSGRAGERLGGITGGRSDGRDGGLTRPPGECPAFR